MARPRVIKYGEGEIKLMNLSKEEADKVQALIEGAPSAQVAVLSVPVEVAQPTGELPENAIGLFEDCDKRRFSIVVVGYNLETGETKILETKDAGTNKYGANDKFKEMVVKKGIIRQ